MCFAPEERRPRGFSLISAAFRANRLRADDIRSHKTTNFYKQTMSCHYQLSHFSIVPNHGTNLETFSLYSA